MLGQPASWHTVCSPSRCTRPRSAVYSGPIRAVTLIHGGLRSIGVCVLRASMRSSRRPSGAAFIVEGAGCSMLTAQRLRRERRKTGDEPDGATRVTSAPYIGAMIGWAVLVVDTSPSRVADVRRPRWLMALGRWYLGGPAGSAVWALASWLEPRPVAEPDADPVLIAAFRRATARVGLPAIASQAAYIAA